MKRILFPLLFAFVLFISVLMHTNAQNMLSKNVIRLHVIANSDTEADQAVKLLVRDAVLDVFSNREAFINKAAAEKHIQNHLQLAEQTASKVLQENGFTYGVRAEYGSFDFPVRRYGNVVLPAGTYDGLRLHLGEGSGKNWWCVMYPPLCFNDANTSDTQTQNGEVTFNFKFKCIEFLNSL